VQALVETFPWVDIDAQWFLFTIIETAGVSNGICGLR